MNRVLYSFSSLAVLLSIFAFTGFTSVAKTIPQAEQLMAPEFYLEGKTICTGEVLQVPLKVRFFEDLTSMQYTLSWDTDVLRFDSINQVNSNFPDLLFGLTETGSGFMTASWLDPALSGVTLDDETTIFMLNFTAIGDNGMTSQLKFESDPAPFEITQNTNLIDGVTHNDSILIREPILIDAVVENETDAMGNGKVDITIDSGTAPYSFSWSNGASTEDLAAVAAGEYSCTISDANDCGLTVGPYTVDNLVATNNIANLSDISIFPNPAVESIGIQAAFTQVEDLTIRLYDVLGKIQYEEHLTRNAFSKTIEVAHLTRGTYFLELNTNDGHYVEKIVLQND